MKGFFLSTIILFAATVAASTVGYAAEQVTWTGAIRDVVEKRCVICHGSDAAPEYYEYNKNKQKWKDSGKGMRLNSYSHLIFYTAWPDTGALMRRLDDGSSKADKKPGNMYEHLGDNELERQKNLALFKAWVGNWTLKKWNDISKEDMLGIKVTY